MSGVAGGKGLQKFQRGIIVATGSMYIRDFIDERN